MVESGKLDYDKFSFFNPIDRNEVRQNTRVAEILRASLRFGPEHLNLLHDSVEFSSEAEVVGIQEGLEGNQSTQLDWVIEDQNNLIGYESKVKSGLSKSQLKSEIEELNRLNPDGPTILYVITDDYSEPSKVERVREETQYDTRIRWLSWYDFAKAIDEVSQDSIQPEQRILHEMLHQTFDEEGYLMQFDGLYTKPTGETEVMDHQQQIINLAHDAELTLRDTPLMRWRRQRGKDVFHKGDNRQDNLERGSRYLVPQWFMFPFCPREEGGFPGDGVRSAHSVGIHCELWSSKVRPVFRMAPYKGGSRKDTLIENASRFKELAIQSEPSLTMFAGRRRWKIEHTYPPDDIENTLEQEDVIGEEDHKRIFFGYKIDGSHDKPDEVVQELVEKLLYLHQLSWKEDNRSLFYPTVEDT